VAGPVRGQDGWWIWERERDRRLGGVNPRYRRLVIPVALASLILIVVITAVFRG
jgi:hypothetical protein